MTDYSYSKYEQNYAIRKQIITVFMTTYKRPDYIKLAIESVLKQTYSNFYLIVLDNMSKDNTKEVVESFTDDRVIYIEHDGKLTDSNFVYAFQLVKTKYIVVVHDDDILEYSFLETMLSTMQENIEITALSPTKKIIDSDGLLKSNGIEYDGIKVFKGNEYFFQHMISMSLEQGMVFPAAVYNCDLIGSIKDYLNSKAGPAGDQYLWFEICRRGGIIGILGKPLIKYRVHNGQDSTINEATMNLRLLEFLNADRYYARDLNENLPLLATYIRSSLLTSLNYYTKGFYSKQNLKEVYSLVPIFLSKDGKCRWYMVCFKAVIACPNLSSFVYSILRKLKNL